MHAIFPHSTRSFGGANIVLCGDPAQLAPVRSLALYAYITSILLLRYTTGLISRD
jgi:hypothetical protein